MNSRVYTHSIQGTRSRLGWPRQRFVGDAVDRTTATGATSAKSIRPLTFQSNTDTGSFVAIPAIWLK